jgi:serine/threonine-protein kinase
MPLYDGQTLARRLDRAAELEPMPVPEVVAIAVQLAGALAAAHRAGIVHGDVKPANLMLLRGEEVRLLDFGLSCREGAPSLSDLGRAVGTIIYMAPEQIRGAACGPGTDLWSFGAVVYEMLAGRPPFGRTGPQPVPWLMQAILEQEALPLRELRPDVPPALVAIVERCLAKDPAERYGGAEEILSDLRESGLVPAPEPPAARQRRLPWRAAAAVAAALLIAGALFFLLPANRTLEVAVLRPEIEGAVSPAERDRIAGSLQQAARRALSGLPRLRAVCAWTPTRWSPPASTAASRSAGWSCTACVASTAAICGRIRWRSRSLPRALSPWIRWRGPTRADPRPRNRPTAPAHRAARPEGRGAARARPPHRHH